MAGPKVISKLDKFTSKQANQARRVNVRLASVVCQSFCKVKGSKTDAKLDFVLLEQEVI